MLHFKSVGLKTGKRKPKWFIYGVKTGMHRLASQKEKRVLFVRACMQHVISTIACRTIVCNTKHTAVLSKKFAFMEKLGLFINYAYRSSERWKEACSQLQDCIQYSLKKMRKGRKYNEGKKWRGRVEDTCKKKVWVRGRKNDYSKL